MNGLFKAAKKKRERSEAEKAMTSDMGKGLVGGSAFGGAAGALMGSHFGVPGAASGAAYGAAGGAARGIVDGGIDGYLGQKVLGGKFDDSYSGSLKRNVVGGGLRGTAEGAIVAGFTRNPAYLGRGIGGVIRGAGRGTIGKFMKSKTLDKI